MPIPAFSSGRSRRGQQDHSAAKPKKWTISQCPRRVPERIIPVCFHDRAMSPLIRCSCRPAHRPRGPSSPVLGEAPISIMLAALLPLIPGLFVPPPSIRSRPTEAIDLAPCHVSGVPVAIRCGTFMVYEDRAHKRGRRIPLYVRVIPSSASTPAADPLVLVSTGGPGTTNSDVVPYAYARGWSRDRDVVLVDLRGTSGPVADRLDCDLPGSPEAPLGYLQNVFDSALVARCRADLEKHA